MNSNPFPLTNRRARPQPGGLALLLALLLLFVLGGCNLHYLEGQQMEREKRWEQAAIAYHLALIEDPSDADIQKALLRTKKVVARDNFQRYKDYLAQKAFRKAFGRLEDAARQDPEFVQVREEMAKWERVLVGGQVELVLESAQSRLALADQVTMVVRINTPNPGKTLDAKVDIETGYFFAEDLLYDRPSELMMYYSINSIGAKMTFARTRIKKFSSLEFRRFVRYRTPVLDDIKGRIQAEGAGPARPIWRHREKLPAKSWPKQGNVPSVNPHYSLAIQGRKVMISTQNIRPDFTPRFLYLNKKGRRAFVDFGRYETRFDAATQRWQLRRLPLGRKDYFTLFSRNIALQPYFFYRGEVLEFESARGDAS